MSRTLLLLDLLNEIETCLDGAGLDLKVLDRIGNLLDCTPETLKSRGVTVQSLSTQNLGGSEAGDRDRAFARVEDSVLVQMAYRIVPSKQKATRNEALLLEEQIRKVLTSRAWSTSSYARYQSTTRGLVTADRSWWVAALTFTIRRGAALGGG